MVLQASGTIYLSDLAAEYRGQAPHLMSEYYRATTTNVPEHNTTVPVSGGVKLSNFYGTRRWIYPSTQQAKIQPADADSLGRSVSLSADGNTLAIGGHLDDNSGGTDAGSVYIYVREGTTWTQQTRLQASDAVGGDNFGISVDLSSDGNTLAVGANFDDNARGTNAGSVYVFTRSGTTWTQQTRLQASDGAASDNFGLAVALSADGNTLGVGAYLDDANATDSGSAYVFTRSGTTWSQQTKLQVADGAADDEFGRAVALSSDGNTFAVGARWDDNSAGVDAGSVYVYTRSGTTWSLQTRLQASDGAANDEFGRSVALSSDGNTLAVGAWVDDNTGGTNAGSAYVFTRSGTTWTQQAKLEASDAAAEDKLGIGESMALSLDGNTLAVGAYTDDNSGGVDAGSVYVFTRSGTTWTERTRLQAADATANDTFGISVALSAEGDTLATGATGAISAYVFV